MENNNGKGIFYGVIGVATLIVAIIGATFAYFTATTASGQYITGTAATASLSVAVQRLTGFSTSEGADITATNASYVMVPQFDKGLSAALVGTNSTPCIDAAGSLVCSVYKITVQNTGSAAIVVNGTLNFYTSDTLVSNGEDGTDVSTGLTSADAKMYNLKWARLQDPASLTTGYSRTIADANNDIPTTLLTYSSSTQYTTESDGSTPVNYAANNTDYIYQYAFSQTNNDLYGASKTPVTSYAASTDLIDPSDAVSCTGGVCTNGKTTNTTGKYYLAAKDNTGDTKVFYIVVWISENEESQNSTNTGTFVGQVTFNSSAGSGATSTFTEAYNAG